MESPGEVNKTTHRPLPLWMTILAFTALLGFLIFIGVGLQRAQAGPITIGKKVPNFDLTTFDGETIRLENLLGKVVVINFWASWCDPCAQEAEIIEQVWREYEPGGEVVFLGIGYTDIEPKALAYLEQYDITYPNGPDLGTKISQMFRIRGVPETYFIDREGKLAYFHYGQFVSPSQIQDVIDPLLEK